MILYGVTITNRPYMKGRVSSCFCQCSDSVPSPPPPQPVKVIEVLDMVLSFDIKVTVLSKRTIDAAYKQLISEVL